MTETSPSTAPETTTDNLARLLSGRKYVSLESFRRDGREVTTPLWFVMDGDRVYCRSGENTFKIKRVRRNPLVTVAPCNFNGQVSGPRVPARVEFVPEEEWPHLKRLFLRRYPFGYTLEIGLLEYVRRAKALFGRARPRGRQVFYEIRAR